MHMHMHDARRFRLRGPRRGTGAALAFAAVALLTVTLPGPAVAQPIVRITRGEGAIDADGQTLRLGSTPARPPTVVVVESPSRICCPGPTPARCMTERQVSLGASRQEVVDRYGPPGSGSTPALLRYVGIEFTLGAPDGQVTRICAVR